MKSAEFDTRAEEAIAAEVFMISGCQDSQISADVSNVKDFKLPDPQGKAGGACTAALLGALYAYNKSGKLMTTSWVDLLKATRANLKKKGYEQVPQLTSSRFIDVNKPFKLVNDTASENGTKRAVLIGINYVGMQGELSGCHNDVRNVKEYLVNIHGFKEKNMKILMDDGKHGRPTKRNIMAAYRDLVRKSKAGDTVFIHYSGHGGSVPDLDGDEDDGFDETLIPIDFKKKGQILDDTLLREFVKPMAKGVYVIALMDCCHSGTVLDLPYCFTADGEVMEMERVHNFDFDFILGITAVCCCVWKVGYKCVECVVLGGLRFLKLR